MVADEDVGDGEEADRERERREHLAAFCEVSAERRRHEPDARRPVAKGQRSAERDRCEE